MADLYLMACPFCDGKPVHRESHGWHGIGCETAKCPGYMHELMFRSGGEAAALWNRRSAAVPTVPQGYKAVPLKALHKLREVAAPEWTDEMAPSVVIRLRQLIAELLATPGVRASAAHQPLPIKELLVIYDEQKGDWCAIVREVERRHGIGNAGVDLPDGGQQ